MSAHLGAVQTRRDQINTRNQLNRVRGHGWDLPGVPDKPVEVTYHRMKAPSFIDRAISKVQRFFTRRRA